MELRGGVDSVHQWIDMSRQAVTRFDKSDLQVNIFSTGSQERQRGRLPDMPACDGILICSRDHGWSRHPWN